jgi:hypothetical protein
MNFSSLTGLLIFVGALLWVGSFIPSWVKRSENVQEVRETRQLVTREIRAQRPAGRSSKQSTVAQQAISIGRRRRVIGSITVVGAFVGVFALTDVATLGWVAVAGLSISALALISNRGLGKKQRALLANSIQDRSSMASNYRSMIRTATSLAPQVSAPAVDDDRSWTPRTIPAPLHTGHIGSLEQPTLAEVTQLPVKREVAATETTDAAPAAATEAFGGAALDEILRRRRAI